MISLCFVSFLTAISEKQMIIELMLLVCININSILMPFTFIYLILYLRNDLSSAIVNMSYYKDDEYYIDIDEDVKNSL